jgi:hypothetical protein
VGALKLSDFEPEPKPFEQITNHFTETRWFGVNKTFTRGCADGTRCGAR